MGAQENVDLVRRGYAAFSTGDMSTLNGLFAVDAVWRVPGGGVLSGPKEGRDAILAFFGQTMELSSGTFAVSVVDIAASGERVYVLQHTDAKREGKVIDRDSVNVFQVSDGVVTEVAEFLEDTGESDAFWA
jgi:uncharacterized protein